MPSALLAEWFARATPTWIPGKILPSQAVPLPIAIQCNMHKATAGQGNGYIMLSLLHRFQHLWGPGLVPMKMRPQISGIGRM